MTLLAFQDRTRGVVVMADVASPAHLFHISMQLMGEDDRHIDFGELAEYEEVRQLGRTMD